VEEPPPEEQGKLETITVSEKAEVSPEPEMSPSPEKEPTPEQIAAQSCVALTAASSDKWCVQNCGNVPPNCPASLCSCDAEEEAPQQAAQELVKKLKKELKKELVNATSNEPEKVDKEDKVDKVELSPQELKKLERVEKPKPEKAEVSPEPEISPEPEGAAASCTAVSGQTAADDKWCVQNCGNVPPNCPAELCSCEDEVAVPGEPSDAKHHSQQEAFMSADEERVKAADAARVAAEEKLRSIEQQSTKSGEMSVAEREEWQKARDREIASDPGPVDGIPAQFRAVAPV
jgi:hypothetical protein